jgi:hypothetical protein
MSYLTYKALKLSKEVLSKVQAAPQTLPWPSTFGFLAFENTAAVRASTVYQDRAIAVMRGGYSINDGWGGVWVFDAAYSPTSGTVSGVEIEDDGTGTPATIRPSGIAATSAGRWRKLV